MATYKVTIISKRAYSEADPNVITVSVTDTAGNLVAFDKHKP